VADWPLQFLRPLWLLGLIPLFALALSFISRKQVQSAWENAIDPALHAYVLEPETHRRSLSKWLLLLAWFVALVFLSGPVWQQQDVPVFQGQRAQVVLFDLSYSMLSDDIKPDRMTRARFKLSDMLERARGVQIALIAFAERPYVVSPLSDDAKTIAAFVASLSPNIMPAQGSRMDLAMDKGVELLDQAGIAQGHLVLLTDSEVGARSIEAAARIMAQGHRLSVIGVGTKDGAPLRGADGRFLQDARGAIVVPQLDEAGLAGLARSGGGVYAAISSDNSDLEKLQAVQDELLIVSDDDDGQRHNYWLEYSPYGLWLLLLSALFLFRRGLL